MQLRRFAEELRRGGRAIPPSWNLEAIAALAAILDEAGGGGEATGP